jgi:hypothetical protein
MRGRALAQERWGAMYQSDIGLADANVHAIPMKMC